MGSIGCARCWCSLASRTLQGLRSEAERLRASLVDLGARLADCTLSQGAGGSDRALTLTAISDSERGLTPLNSSHREWAFPSHICTGTGRSHRLDPDSVSTRCAHRTDAVCVRARVRMPCM